MAAASVLGAACDQRLCKYMSLLPGQSLALLILGSDACICCSHWRPWYIRRHETPCLAVKSC